MLDNRRLSALTSGESAIIAGIDGEPVFRRRLLEMGFLHGTRVRAGKVAPLGDPLTYELRGYEICLRREDAGRIRLIGESG